MRSSPTSARATRPRPVVQDRARARASCWARRRIDWVGAPPDPGRGQAAAGGPGADARPAGPGRRRGRPPRAAPSRPCRSAATPTRRPSRARWSSTTPTTRSARLPHRRRAIGPPGRHPAHHQRPHPSGLAAAPGALEARRRLRSRRRGRAGAPAAGHRRLRVASPWRSRRPTRPTPDGLRPVVVSLAERQKRHPRAGRQLRHHRRRWASTPSGPATTCWAAPTRCSVLGRVSQPRQPRCEVDLSPAALAHAAADARPLRAAVYRSQHRRLRPGRASTVSADVTHRWGRNATFGLTGTYFTWGGSIDLSRTERGADRQTLTPLGRDIATFAGLADVALDRSDDPLDPHARLAGQRARRAHPAHRRRRRCPT